MDQHSNLETSRSSVEASPARTSVALDEVEDLQEPAPASGGSSTGSSAKSSRRMSSSKTSQPFAIEDWTKCSGRSLRSGMMRNGTVYPLAPLVPLTKGTASGSWPTPRSCSAMAATITPESVWNQKRFPNLETVVGRRMWPTPQARDYRSGDNPQGKRAQRKAAQGWSMNLNDAVRLWPNCSPTETSGQLNPTWVEWLMGFPAGWTDLSNLETP